MSRSKESSYKEKIKRLSSGLLGNITDVCLFTVFFHLQSYQIAYGRKNIGEAINQAIHLTKIINTKNLSRIIYQATAKGYLEKRNDYLEITALGKERLKRNIPFYLKKRPWDGKLYLITYDIPENKKSERNILREYLKQLGCGMLQKSVWLTPYNPKGIIGTFLKERRLTGLVLVSELKEGSYIGGKNILETLERVYGLREINDLYQKFINKVESKSLIRAEAIFNYLSILKRDPQLPFALLPDNWLGEEAYNLFKKIAEK